MFEKIKNKLKKVNEIEDEKLYEYLSNFNCKNCHNHCSLNKIKCGRGLGSQDEKIKEYNNSK